MKINGGLLELKQTLVDQMYKYASENPHCAEFAAKHEQEQEKLD